MIALWIAAALQSDWSELRLERELSAEEVEILRGRLDAWGAARGVPAFRGFGRAVKIERALRRPVFQVRATTLDERRELVVERRPYEGEGALVRTVNVIDLQGPPLPPFRGFEARHWRVPVEGSARTYPCPGCGADGRVNCSRCQGQRKVSCDRCRKSGKVDCSTCGGTSKIRCHYCFGWGNSGMGSKRRSCTWCNGSGKRSCGGGCSSGKVRCDPCRGDGRIDCGGCRGRGDQECDRCKGRKTMVDAQEIVIWLRPSVREETVSLLPGKWLTLGGATDAWIAAEGDEVEGRIGLIPDPALADAARRTLEASKAGVAGRARGTQLRVRKTPCVQATLTWEEAACEVAWVGDEILFDVSPAAAWAGREAQRAEELFGTDRDEANRVAAAALRADPECWRARRLINAIENIESEKRQRLEHERRVSSVKQILLTALFVLAALIAAAMVLLKLYLRRRKLLDPRGPQAL